MASQLTPNRAVASISEVSGQGAGAGGAPGSRDRDADEAFDAELAALRTERQQLAEVPTGINGCVLIALRDGSAPEPDAVVAKLFEELGSSSLPPTRDVIRINPLSTTCKWRLPEIEKTLSPLLEPHFGPDAPPTRWQLVFKKRATDPSVTAREWTIQLAKLVDPRHPVDLKNPEVSVLVDVFRSSCGLCVTRNYKRCNDFNCQHKNLLAAGSQARSTAKVSAYARAEGDASEVDASAVCALLAKRGAARGAKQFRSADRLLAELHDMGVEVLDKERTWRGGCDPTTLRRGDWSCPACGENCFASRSECFKCHAPKPSGAQG